MTETSYIVDGQQLVYRCDPTEHRVVATGQCGNVKWAFGGQGTGPGAFNTPVSVTLVRPEFDGECLSGDVAESAWLAVADYGNNRVQIFELDGTWVGTIDTDDTDAVGPPCTLAWRAPFLEIGGVEGGRTRVHLSATLLWASAQVPAMPFVLRLRSRRAAWDLN